LANSRGASLQTNKTARQPAEERQNLRTPKLLAQNCRSLCIDPVQLKKQVYPSTGAGGG
jgi:hypothetical protein